MEIIEEKQDTVSVFRLNGRLDSNTSQGLEEKVFGAILDGSKNMVIDFKDIDYISSAGLRVILKATKALHREKGQIIFQLKRIKFLDHLPTPSQGFILEPISNFRWFP